MQSRAHDTKIQFSINLDLAKFRAPKTAMDSNLRARLDEVRD
jgi:hypothetical protein